VLPLKKLKSRVRNCVMNFAVTSRINLSWPKGESKFTETGQESWPGHNP
jgi:hypothetical protein